MGTSTYNGKIVLAHLRILKLADKPKISNDDYAKSELLQDFLLRKERTLSCEKLFIGFN